MKSIEPCGSKPNCVCSLNEKSEKSYFEPLKIKTNPIPILKKVFKKKKIEIVEESENYLHGVATTKIFRFKDDVEFFYDQSAELLHFKSKSRVGHSDLGTNRKRIKNLLKSIKI